MGGGGRGADSPMLTGQLDKLTRGSTSSKRQEIPENWHLRLSDVYTHANPHADTNKNDRMNRKTDVATGLGRTGL